jgi:hypothetical protein
VDGTAHPGFHVDEGTYARRIDPLGDEVRGTVCRHLGDRNRARRRRNGRGHSGCPWQTAAPVAGSGRAELRPGAARELIVEVTRVAMEEATQASYSKVALLLGEDLTYAIEQLSGMPAPARAEDDDLHSFDPATLRSDR